MAFLCDIYKLYWSYKTACEQGHRMIFYNLNKIEKHHQIILNLYMDSYENWFSLIGRWLFDAFNILFFYGSILPTLRLYFMELHVDRWTIKGEISLTEDQVM